MYHQQVTMVYACTVVYATAAHVQLSVYTVLGMRAIQAACLQFA